MKRIAKSKFESVEYLYWDISTNVDEAKEFFNNNDEWKVCEYNIEKDPSAYWVNIVHEEEIIAYKTYIVKTSYGIITLNELAFEALFDKIGANQ